jgi:hypothetical protein
VGRELLQQPFYSDRVLATLALTDAEQEDMLTRLGCRDLAAEVEDATLIHLLLRADSINRRTISWRRLRVERVVPLHAPDKKSLWRKQKLLLPAEAGGSSSAVAGDQWVVDADVAGASSELRRSVSPVFAAAKLRGSPAASASSLDEGSSSRSNSNSSRRSLAGSPGSSDAIGQDGSGAASTSGSSSSSGVVPPGMREVRYWFEVQRSHWRNRLGNLVLLQSTAQVGGLGYRVARAVGLQCSSKWQPTPVLCWWHTPQLCVVTVADLLDPSLPWCVVPLACISVQRVPLATTCTSPCNFSPLTACPCLWACLPYLCQAGHLSRQPPDSRH